LSSKAPIGYVDIRASVHATEDVDKVLQAVYNVLPKGTAENVVFRKSSLTGHHGNPIILLETRIKDRTLTRRLVEKLSAGLSMLDKELLNREIGQHVENGNLYVRLDKQLAYANELKLGSSDPIHFRIHFKRHGDEEVIATCRELGLLP